MEFLKKNTAYIALSLITLMFVISLFTLFHRRSKVLESLTHRQTTSDPAIHLVGAYTGQIVDGEDDRVWWEKCGELDHKECHKQYAGTRPQTYIDLHVAPFPEVKEPLTLVLVGQEKIEWRLALASGVDVKKVMLIGDYPQTVTGLPPSALLEVYTRQPSDCEQCSRGEVGPIAIKKDKTFLPMLDWVQNKLGHDPGSVQLTYQTKQFHLFPSLVTFERQRFLAQITQQECSELIDQLKTIDQKLAEAKKPNTVKNFKNIRNSLIQSIQEKRCHQI